MTFAFLASLILLVGCIAAAFVSVAAGDDDDFDDEVHP